MLEDSFSDNIRQTKVIIKYEFKKYLRGKRIIIFGLLVAIILFLITIFPYIFGEGLVKDPKDLANWFIVWIALLVPISALLFGSGAIASEFEERTALILFTRPIRKWSIYLGKVIVACTLGFIFIMIYYALTAIISVIVAGSIVPNLPLSFMMSLLIVLATTCFAILMSSLFRKSSTAAILTFVMMFIVFDIITFTLIANSIDPWFMLYEAASIITSSINNESYDILTSTCVMLAWAIVTGMTGYLVFKRREL